MKKLIILYLNLAFGLCVFGQQIAVSYEVDPVSDQEALMHIYLLSLTENPQQIQAINFSLALPENCLKVESYNNLFVEAWTDYLQEVQIKNNLDLSYNNTFYQQRWQYGCADPGLPGTAEIIIPASDEAPLLAMTLSLKGSCLDEFYLETQEENPINQIGNISMEPVPWIVIYPSTDIEFNSRQEVKIFPNPVEDKLNINFNGDFQEMQIGLTDQTGRIIRSKRINPFENPNNQFDLQELATGVYLLTITTLEDTRNLAQVKVLKK